MALREHPFCYNRVVVALLAEAESVQSRLAGAADAYAAEDVERLTDLALAQELVAVRRQIDRLELEFSRRLLRFERQRGFAADGAVSVVSWLRSACRLSRAAAAQAVDVARHLGDLPATEEGLQQGTIGFHHAAVIARCAAELGAEPVRRVETTLVEAAERLDPGRLGLVTRRLHYCVSPDGALRDANEQHARRWMHLSQTLDGVFVLDGRLDAEGGALLRTAINALDTPAAGDDRTAAQRRADALVELAWRQLNRGHLPSVAGERPHLTVTAPEAALGGVGHAGVPELGWAGPVVAETARRLGCDAAVSRIRVAQDGSPLDADRTIRTVPAAMRRALVLRDHGCRFPGCDRPPEWTDAHHVRHWADGGETRLDNLVLLCRRHHRVVHEGGWRLVLEPDAGLAAVPP
ncbi:MAG TPA: DUF222 domain-containing protein [Candidatus Dormibacteraeota bacterium]|jgi:hypothetical protein|nr:DUF222 domain-containing protein [Candidatus Dormibacteraeota bacterium]